MRPIVFFPLVIIMYLAIPYCLYQYNYFSQIEAEQAKTQALVLSNNVKIDDQEKAAEDSALYGDMDVVHNEKMGFLAGAVLLFIIPSLIISFKGKLLKD
jgi:hypothetical protein